MKIYELMDRLSKLPAGAEAEFVMLMTLDEFTKCPVADSIGGKDAYRISVKISEAVEVTDCSVVLYS